MTQNNIQASRQPPEAGSTASSGPLTGANAAAGPLRVSAANPRYFTVASGDAAEQKAIYLTGSHIWNNFHDGMGPGADCGETPERFDYDAYLNSSRSMVTTSSGSGAGSSSSPRPPEAASTSV